MSANSLTTGLPTAVQVIPSDQNKENNAAASRDPNQRNIVLSKEVCYSGHDTFGPLQKFKIIICESFLYTIARIILKCIMCHERLHWLRQADEES